MILAVASGRGRTGKTTVSVKLARVLSSDVWLFCCDAEEPNGRLFLRSSTIKEELVW
jgi:MinD superfamily P-loop ATPase